MAFAEAAASGSDGITQLIPLVLIMVIFWVLLIRPQQKKMKEHNEMLTTIKKGDKVITGGGIFGRVTASKDNVLTIEIAEGVNIKVKQDTISGLQESPEPKAKKATKNKK